MEVVEEAGVAVAVAQGEKEVVVKTLQ